MYGAKATWPTLSTFNKVDRVEFNFVASVYWLKEVVVTSRTDSTAVAGAQTFPFVTLYIATLDQTSWAPALVSFASQPEGKLTSYHYH